MPDTKQNRERDHSRDSQEQLDRRQDVGKDRIGARLAAAAESAATGRHPHERRALDETAGRLLDRVRTTGADRDLDTAAIAGFAAAQREQLAERQRLELDAAAGLASRPQQDIARALQELRSTTAAVDARMSADRTALVAALSSENSGADRQALLDDVLRAQEEQRDALAQQGRRALGLDDARSVEERESARRGVQLDRDVADAVRARLDHALGNRQLPDDAVRRIALEARGRVTLAERAPDARLAAERAAVGRVKGQLFEEMLERFVQPLLGEFNAGRPPHEHLEFIAGHRITDEFGQKLTDGLLARRDAATDELAVVLAFEAKSGAAAAGELTRRVDALTEQGREDALAEAMESARDEVLGPQRQDESVEDYARRQALQRAALTEAQRRAIEEATTRHLAQLTSSRARTELGGQVRATIERLAETRLIVDRQSVQLAADRRRTEVVSVLPDDVRRGQDQALRLGVQAQELQRAAEAVVEELKRRGLL